MNQLPEHYVYKPEVIDFVTVAAQTCLLLESAGGEERAAYVGSLCGLLPLLYVKAGALQPGVTGDGFVEQYVTEADYDEVRESIRAVMEPDDAFLEVFQDDMAYSDTPILSTVSENLADIYQELKDMAGNYQTGDEAVMGEAVAACIEAYWQHWGQKVVNVMRALHALRVQLRLSDGEEGISDHGRQASDANRNNTEETKPSHRDAIFNYYKD